MKPGDLLMIAETTRIRFWLIEGVHLGADGCEDLVAIRSLDLEAGSDGTRKFVVMHVPKAMIERSAQHFARTSEAVVAKAA